MFAYEHADIVPDIITLSKALTGGTLSLAATVASEEIYQTFLDEVSSNRIDAWPHIYGKSDSLCCRPSQH